MQNMHFHKPLGEKSDVNDAVGVKSRSLSVTIHHRFDLGDRFATTISAKVCCSGELSRWFVYRVMTREHVGVDRVVAPLAVVMC